MKDLNEGQKNLYLKKIVLNAATPDTKVSFVNDYIKNDETIQHFVGAEEPAATAFSDQFYDSFKKIISAQAYLVGDKAISNKAPAADGSLKHDQEKDLYRFGYYILHDFEESRIKTIKGDSLSADDKKALALGKLKLVRMVDGTEQVISEETLRHAVESGTGEMKVTPYIEFDLGQKMINNPNPASTIESEVQAAMKNAGVTDVMQLPVVDQAATIASLATDFNASIIATSELAMQLNGLELVEPLTAILDADGKSTGRYKGKVRDVNGKILDVIVDLINDPHDTTPKPKFIFNFDDDNNPGKVQIILGANDIGQFEERNKDGSPIRRKSANEVANISGINVFRKPEHVEFPENHNQTSLADFTSTEPDYIPEGYPNNNGFHAPRLQIPRPLKSARVSDYVPKFKPVSIPQQKSAIATKPKFEPDSKSDTQQTQAQPQEQSPSRIQRPTQPQQQQPQPKNKKSKSWIAAVAGGSAVAGGLGAAGIGAMLANTDQTTQTVTMLIKIAARHWIVQPRDTKIKN